MKSFIKTGFGYDSHRFLTAKEIDQAKKGAIDTETDYIDPKKPLIIGGEIAKGDFPPFKARSDGDVLFHAAVNAILSALGKDESRDIGTLFPNVDKANTNRESSDFLKEAAKLVGEEGFIINDLKLMLKGLPRIDLKRARQNLANHLSIGEDTVLIQGTSGEEMDGAGRGDGVEVFGICTLIDKEFLEKLL